MDYIDYIIPGLFVGTMLLGFLLLRIFRGKRLTASDYIIALYNFFALGCHTCLDPYFLYTPRLTRKAENEPVPKLDDFLGCYKAAVRQLWRNYADGDVRFYADEYQVFLKTYTYHVAIGGGILTFLTFLGYLRGGKWAYGMQIAAATWHLAVVYWYYMPEYLTGFQNIKKFNYIALMNAPFVVFPILAIPHGLSKLSCGDSNTSCPVASTGSGADHKKKKQ